MRVPAEALDGFRYFSVLHLEELSVLIESHDAGVLITICDVDVAIWCDEEVAWPVEQVLCRVVTLDTSFPKRHEGLSFRRELINHVLYSVRNPHEAVTIDMN